MRIRRPPGLPIVVALALLSSGCEGFPGRVREHTDPPDFRTLTRDEIGTAMQTLAAEVHAIDVLMRSPEPIDPRRRARVIEHLAAMERAVDVLGPESWPSSHPLIDANLDTFRGDLELARAGVEADPPEYFFVGTLSAACTYCHGSSR